MTQAAQIADFLASSTASPETVLTQVSSIDAATPGSIVFAGDKSSLAQAIASPAGLILTSAPHPDPRTVQVRNPRLAFAQVYGQFFAPRPEAAIHPTAILGSGAEIGDGTSIGANAVIGENVRMGQNCGIHARVTIYPGVTLGDRVTIQAGAVLGSAGFGFAADPATGAYVPFPQIGTLIVEDDVEIGANTTIDRGALGETRIGQGTKIDNLVHIAHNCRIGRNVVIAAQTGISGSSVVEDGAILGGQVGIGEHATVGAGVILGGGAGVLTNKKMQGPGQVFWGRPARPLKQYLRDLARLSKG